MARTWHHKVVSQLFNSRRGKVGRPAKPSTRPQLEELEVRNLMSGSATPVGLGPIQLADAYGYNSISYNGTTGTGSGQTIAIIDPNYDPDIVSDLSNFDSHYGLANPTPGAMLLLAKAC